MPISWINNKYGIADKKQKGLCLFLEIWFNAFNG